MDSWYSPAPRASEPPSTTLVWHTDFEEAERNQIIEVERALANFPIVEITGSIASRLAAREIATPANKRLFLVRSVRFEAHGEYTVVSDRQSIRIHHRSLGFDAPIVRQGLVVLLEQKPKEVYCSCSMAR